MTDDPQPLEQRWKTETIVRQFDREDRLISETTTVVTHTDRTDADGHRQGMYL